MATWILHDSDHERAVLYCSVTESPFGPGFHEGADSGEAALNFLRFLPRDARAYGATELENFHSEWFARTHCENCGNTVDFEGLNELEGGLDALIEAMGGENGKSLKSCKRCPAPKAKTSPTLTSAR